MNTDIRWTRRMGLVMLGLLLAAGGCAVNPVTGEQELSLISTEQEIAMGDEAAPQFEKEFGGKVEDATLQNYVRSVGLKLAAHSPRQMPYDYVLVKSDVPNAFALPGGKIFISAGLMRRMTNERQLAAVLGHETGHVAAKHNVRGMQRQMGAQVLVEVAGTILGGTEGAAAAKAAQVVTAVANLKYSRDDEYQADKLGVEYMGKAGYNPYGMVELLEVLKGLSDSEPGSLAEMFQTHPLTSKRIEQAQQTVDEQYPDASAKAADPRAAQFTLMRDRLIESLGQ